MKTRWIGALLLGLFSATAAAAPNELTPKQKEQGFRLLFDGMSLDGWQATGNRDAWEVQDGTIHLKPGRGGNLYHAEQFENFRLLVDYKIAPKTNSGVFFRWSDLKDPVHTGIEMQVFDSHGKAAPDQHDDGAIYDIIKPEKNMTKPAGEWNRAQILCRGSKIEIRLNGEKISEMDVDRWTEAGKNPDGTANKFRYAYKALPRKGYIGFQDHGGEVWFRNIKIKPL